MPESLLAIDNLDGAGATPADAKPGRGLAGIVDSCHARFTPVDLHVFAVLAKVLRVLPVTALTQTRGQLLDSRILIFRGEDGGDLPDYRADVWVTPRGGQTLGRVAVKIELAMDESGRGGLATLWMLPPCDPGEVEDCTSVSDEEAFVVVFPTSPVFSGDFWATDETTPAVSNFEFGMEPFFWPDLLAGTTWISP